MTPPLPLKGRGGIEAFSGLSVRYLKENHCVPLHREDGQILVAMADPTDGEVRAALALALGAPVRAVPAAEDEILDLITQVYEPGSPLARLAGDLETEDLDLVREEVAGRNPASALLEKASRSGGIGRRDSLKNC